MPRMEVLFNPVIAIDNSLLFFPHCGAQKCPPGYSYGPLVRHPFSLHYILSGKGKFELCGRCYALGPYDGFLVFDNESCYYEADMDDPWHYRWVSFGGTQAFSLVENLGLSLQRPIFHYDKDDELGNLMQESFRCFQHYSDEYEKLIYLYRVFSLLYQNHLESTDPRQNFYVPQALDYLRLHYTSPLTIQELAQRLGLNRSYLYRIFKEVQGCSPQEYLLELRHSKAQELLRNSNLTITQIAESCGFSSVMHFSASFKKRFGLSPVAFREDAVTIQLIGDK